MVATFVTDRREALERALSFIEEPFPRIGVGGSVTLAEIGLMEALAKGNYNFINQYEEGISEDEGLRRRKISLLSDIYFTSTNAVTENGWLVNVDGQGNRVAAMAFGPATVVVIVGRNKIRATLYEALDRIRTIAAPRNTKRLNKETPCVESGVCQDCDAEDRICNTTSIIKRQADPERIHVIIVDEDLGY